jgi:hypothetical protein
MEKYFRIPDEIMKARQAKKIKVSSVVLYSYYCLLYDLYQKDGWFYYSTKATMSKTNFKRSTLFACKKELILNGFIKQNKNNQIKVVHLWKKDHETPRI